MGATPTFEILLKGRHVLNKDMLLRPSKIGYEKFLKRLISVDRLQLLVVFNRFLIVLITFHVADYISKS